MTASRQPPTHAHAKARLSRDGRGRLIFQREHELPVEDVRIVRCCPWSNPWQYLAVRDAGGHEVHLFTTLDEAEPPTRRVIEQELASQEFLPRITAIDAVDDRFGAMTWYVRTDRGAIELLVKDTDDVHVLSDGRVLIRDHAGGIFQVTDPDRLDGKSRMRLGMYLT